MYIKNYFDQQQELKVARIRLEYLEEKKHLFYQKTQPKAAAMNKIMVTNGSNTNKFLDYVERIEELDEKITNLKQIISMLEYYLKRMEMSLRIMKGILEKIFVDRYIDNLSVKKIAIKENYSQSDVYRKLSIIRRILKEEKKREKINDKIVL